MYQSYSRSRKFLVIFRAKKFFLKGGDGGTAAAAGKKIKNHAAHDRRSDVEVRARPAVPVVAVPPSQVSAFKECLPKSIVIPPEASLTMSQFQLSLDSMTPEVVLDLIQKHTDLWLRTTSNRISVQRLFCAMTNLVLKVSNNDETENFIDNPRFLLLKIYGNNSLNHFDATRIQNTLAQQGIAPIIYATFDSGHIEEYIPHTSVSATEFRHESVIIQLMPKLRQVHQSLDVIVKQGFFRNENYFWARLEKWRESAYQNVLKSGSKELSTRDACIIDAIKNMGVLEHAMITQLNAEASLHHNDSQHSHLVLGHTDLHHGNVLRRGYDLLIIDYDYCIPIVRGLEFAIIFCEMCADYDSALPHIHEFEYFPSQEQRYKCYASYLGTFEETELAAMDAETMHNVPLANLFAGHWGLSQWVGRSSPTRDSGSMNEENGGINFDHLLFALHRYQRALTVVHAKSGLSS
jgi:thiamine kinase-like enzyme